MSQDAILAVFYEECDECLAAAEAALAALARREGEAADLVNTVFRAVHSVKGGAGAFGLDALVSFAHRFETALDELREGRVEPLPAIVALLERARDALEDHVAAARTGFVPPPATETVAALDALIAGEMPAASNPIIPEPAFEPLSAPANSRRLRMAPSGAALADGGEPLYLLRELLRLGCVLERLDLSALPPLADFNPAESYLAWELAIPDGLSEAEVREVFDFAGDEIAVSITEPAAAAEDPWAKFATPIAREDPAPSTWTQAPLPVEQSRPLAPSAPATHPVVLATLAPPRAEPNESAASAPAAPRVVRVDLDRVDRVVNLVGELVISQAMLAQRLDGDGRAAEKALEELVMLTRELQDAVMAMRAQPIRTVFNRIPKLVRELEVETGKQVALEFAGEATEVDKTVVERIGEPLVHMIRNAVDHGIERPEDRAAAGKPQMGTLRLSAEHKGGRILIQLSDDGRGIDRARVRAKAIERDVIAPEAALSDEEIDQLIFAPGFSTATAISNISGRGVGMDVVQQSVAALGGRVSVSSRPGLGTSFTLALPLTLAILDGMVVEAAGLPYVIPVGAIIEIVRPLPGALRPAGSVGLVLDLGAGRAGDRYVPVVPVSRALGLPGDIADPAAGVLVVVDCERFGLAALAVDGVRDQRQVVIKSLDANFRSIPGIAGATIMGDGSVALILDVEAIASAAARPAEDRPLKRTGTEG